MGAYTLRISSRHYKKAGLAPRPSAMLRRAGAKKRGSGRSVGFRPFPRSFRAFFERRRKSVT